jgi:3-oxoacyl-[acyl-carrier protein] reductase
MSTISMQTALVTGASRGIGRATAQALARAGARVLVHYGNSAADADSLVAEIRAMGGRADALQADLGVPEGAAALANQVRSIVGDRLDVLVANAGVGKAAAFEDHTIEDFDKLFATNVRGPFFVVQQLLPLLGEGSSVILVSSGASRGAVTSGLRRDQGRSGHPGEALGFGPRPSWHPGECGGSGRYRD